MTKQTKKYKKTYKTVSVISWLLCFGFGTFLLIFMLCGKKDGTPIKEVLGSYLYGIIAANIPLVLITLLVKDKIKPVMWAGNVILSNIIWGGIAIYLVFLAWFVDIYILTYIKDLYKDKYRINAEIDKRE